jgi:sulfur carrier protein
MTVTVNGTATELASGATVADVVGRLASGREGTAVAVNGAVVPRSTWSVHALEDGDAIEVLVAVQGG